ncbi:hypothetical protein CEXT_430441 [Caerostris extrusa]|uniref:Uncharacterized protein n=1 Tax=Caerostris extrusa TaxID=172846 RepID=A0AAV4XQT1_CAEEX|nr:hypothetical protein CEXT_430441 [Caerostris extrusa]
MVYNGHRAISRSGSFLSLSFSRPFLESGVDGGMRQTVAVDVVYRSGKLLSSNRQIKLEMVYNGHRAMSRSGLSFSVVFAAFSGEWVDGRNETDRGCRCYLSIRVIKKSHRSGRRGRVGS